MERYKYDTVVSCSNEGGNLMVLILEIILGIGMITIAAIFCIINCNDLINHKEHCDVVNLLSIIGLVFSIIALIIGLIMVTGNTEYATKIIIEFLNTEL